MGLAFLLSSVLFGAVCLLWCPLASGIALSRHIPGGLPPLPGGLFGFVCQHLCPILFKLSKALEREVEDKLTHTEKVTQKVSQVAGLKLAVESANLQCVNS